MIRIFLFLLCAFVFSSAQAQTLKPLPKVQSLDINTFVAQAQVIKKTYPRDPTLGFKVEIPDNFIERPFVNLKTYVRDDVLFGEIARYDGPITEDYRPYFSVHVVELSRFISARNWFMVQMLTQGHTLRSIEADKKGDNFEALYIRFDELGRTEIVRTKGQLQGKRIVVSEYAVPVQLWQEQGDYQTYAIKSFEVKETHNLEKPEQMMSFNFLESFSMQYPSGWRLEKEENALENQLDIVLKTANETRIVIARIHITMVADQSIKDSIDRNRYVVSLPTFIKNRRQEILDKGYLIDPVMERRSYDLSVNNVQNITEIYPLHRKLTDYVTHKKAPTSHEFWLTVIKGTKDTGRNYVISMMAPARVGSLSDWALAAKAYELIVESIR